MNVNNISQVNRCQWGATSLLNGAKAQNPVSSLANVFSLAQKLGNNKGDSSLLQKLSNAIVNCFKGLGDNKTFEKAAKGLLSAFVKAGIISQEDADKIQEQLFPDSSSSETKTSSTGTAKAHSVGGYSGAGGAGGFLWKPISDSNGNLVVLMPSEISSEVDSVVIKDKNGNVLETGKFSAIANGGRAHFRFSKPGSAYGQSVTVEAKLKNGRVCTFQVNDTSKRCG